MKKRNLIICAATNYVLVEGGYLSRILLEIGNLYLRFNIYVLIPDGRMDDDLFKGKAKVIKYPYSINNGMLSYAKNIFKLKKEFKNAIEEIDNPIIYCEALVGSMWILDIAKKRNLQIVFDCHGTEFDEILMRRRNIKRLLKAYVVKHYEKVAINSSQLLITVTNKQYEKWKIEKKHVKYPMVPASHFFDIKNYRNEIREELDIPSNSTVFVYSGGTSVWQMCKETMQLFKEIEERDENAFLLVMTSGQDIFRKIIDEYQIKQYRILTAKYEDVPKYLDAADYGFCIRANHIVNNVASPTKILEYLSRNVKPIITDCIGDFSDELGSLNLACIMNDSLNNYEVINRESDFNGIDYVNKVKTEYVQSYINAINELL